MSLDWVLLKSSLPPAGRCHCFRELTHSHIPHISHYWGVISGTHLRFSALLTLWPWWVYLVYTLLCGGCSIYRVYYSLLPHLTLILILLKGILQNMVLLGELSRQVQSHCPWTHMLSNCLNPLKTGTEYADYTDTKQVIGLTLIYPGLFVFYFLCLLYFVCVCVWAFIPFKYRAESIGLYIPIRPQWRIVFATYWRWISKGQCHIDAASCHATWHVHNTDTHTLLPVAKW